MVHAYGRRALRLERISSYLGSVSGGEEGARISGKLNMPMSPDTILRTIKDPSPAEKTSPRVVGIDEFAFRKGLRYGTILVDMEKHEVIDLLPDRSSDTVAFWLQAHPGIEVISRDRSGAFAEAANRGAPQARQVADRWHLIKNLCEALVRLIARNFKLVKEAGQPESSKPVAESEPEVKEPEKPTKAQKQAAMRREHRLERYSEIVSHRSQGVAIREIARRVGVDRRTVRRFLRSDGFPERVPRKAVPSILDPFKAYLLERWHAGCHNGARLYREIAAKGYGGRATLVRQFLSALRQKRKPLPEGERKPSRVPSVRQVAFLLTKEDPEEHQKIYLARLFELNPNLERASLLAKQFIGMVKARQPERLTEWIERADQSGISDLKSFAAGLRKDREAVEAAMTLEWSNGQVEGQINRLKAIKRQMYGRAKFGLLRKRVLFAA